MKVSKILSISIALVLLFSFTIHAIDFDHVHPSGVWMGIESALHSMNRNLFAIAVISMFIVALMYRLFSPLNSFIKRFEKRSGRLVFDTLFNVFDPLRIALRQGILRPQVY